MLAQRLYEGVELGDEGSVALITYMRTDSVRVSNDAIAQVREHIGSNYGASYLPEKPNFFASSNKQAQEAHEAIRPTDVAILPARVRPHLNDEQFKTRVTQPAIACRKFQKASGCASKRFAPNSTSRSRRRATRKRLSSGNWKTRALAGLPPTLRSFRPSSNANTSRKIRDALRQRCSAKKSAICW